MVTHGHTAGRKQTTEYVIYRGILKRCYNPNGAYYEMYGGSGIKVCDRWRNSFQNFLDDMGFRPSKDHSIDRIDGTKDYSPDNCRWATTKEQNRNMKSNRMITYNGETKCLTDWAEILNIPKDTFTSRLRLGWSMERIATEPIKKTEIKLFTYKGETKPLAYFSNKYGIRHKLLKYRVHNGWDIGVAIETPQLPNGKRVHTSHLNRTPNF